MSRPKPMEVARWVRSHAEWHARCEADALINHDGPQRSRAASHRIAARLLRAEARRIETAAKARRKR